MFLANLTCMLNRMGKYGFRKWQDLLFLVYILTPTINLR